MVRLKKGNKTLVEEVLHGEGGDMVIRREKDHLIFTLPYTARTIELDLDRIDRFYERTEILHGRPNVWVKQNDRNNTEFWTRLDGDQNTFYIVSLLGDSNETVGFHWDAIRAILDEAKAVSEAAVPA